MHFRIRPKPHGQRPLTNPSAHEQDPLARSSKLEQPAVQVALTERPFDADERSATRQHELATVHVAGERHRERRAA